MKTPRPRKPTYKQESAAYFKALGAYLAALRKERNLKQRDLARALGVTQQAVFAYELGERRIPIFLLVKLAGIFGVAVDVLIEMAPLPPSPKRRLSQIMTVEVERLQQLSRAQRRFIARIVDTLLIKKPSRRIKPRDVTASPENRQPDA